MQYFRNTSIATAVKNFILLIYPYVSILENSTYRQRVLQIAMAITYTAVSKHLGSFDRSGFCHRMSLFKAAISQFAKWNTTLATNKVHIDTITIYGIQLYIVQNICLINSFQIGYACND